MIFAPVLITTLDRYEHLRQCLESLSRCTWADQTEVYIALDYPPLDQWERYVSGWEKNRAYLSSIGNMGFKKITVIERRQNYGIWTSKKSNMATLIEEVTKDIDCYIISEDDNVFEPAFLDFMNKGFAKFRNDQSVLSICGYRFLGKIRKGDNTFILQNFADSAWGCGFWKSKLKNHKQANDYVYFRRCFSLKLIIKLYSVGKLNLVNTYLGLCNNSYTGILIDNVWSVYMVINQLYQVMPVFSLVQNIGVGSGVHFSNVPEALQEHYYNNPLYKGESFMYIGKGDEFRDENNSIFYNSIVWLPPFSRQIKSLIKNMVKFVIWR